MSKFGLRKVLGLCENAHEGNKQRRNRCTPPIYGPNFHFTKEFAGRVAETSNDLGDYGRSTIIETALPPPRHRVASPRFAPRSFIAYTRVVKTRAPLQPIGWPSANAPPFTLSFSGGMPSSRITARLAAAYASLCSKRSMSSTDMPVFFRSFRTPGIGASITHSGLTPAVLYATTRASGVTSCRSAASLDMTTIAAPPSLNWDAFPAVTCPPSRNTGGSFASLSRDVSMRIPSSTSTRPAPGTWGDDLFFEPAFLGRGRGASMALQCEAIHVLPRDLEPFRDDLAGYAHVKLVVRVPQAVMDHRVDERDVVDPDSPSGLFDQVRGPTHRLHATRQDDVRRTRADHIRCEHHRLQAGAANLVHGHGADAVRQAREQRGLTRWVLTQSGGDDVAHDDLLDVGGDEARAVHRLRDDRAPELDRLDVPKRPSVLANGSAAGARENDVCHGRDLRTVSNEAPHY